MGSFLLVEGRPVDAGAGDGRVRRRDNTLVLCVLEMPNTPVFRTDEVQNTGVFTPRGICHTFLEALSLRCHIASLRCLHRRFKSP